MGILRADPMVLRPMGFALLLGACATLAEGGGGDANLPNALAGPFRALKDPEIGNLRSEPYAIDDDERFLRDPSILDADGDPATLDVIGYFAGREAEEDVDPDPLLPPDQIYALTAVDGRTFGRDPATVLTAGDGWEGGRIGQPSVIRYGAEVWMYYAGEGGIGLATSADGFAFSAQSEPVVVAAAGGWEGGGAVSSPGAVVRPDGVVDLFYDVNRADGTHAIGLARAADGRSFERIGEAPIVVPTEDEVSVETPWVVIATSAEGRIFERVYFSAALATGRREIRLAAREGFDAPLSRGVGAVFGTGSKLEPREPSVIAFERFSLMFLTEKAGSSSALDYPAVAAGLAPAQASLPPADPP